MTAANMAPGETFSRDLRLKAPEGQPWRLSAHIVSFFDAENGCVGPERSVDSTCQANQGELSSALLYFISGQVVPQGDACTYGAPTMSSRSLPVNAWTPVQWSIARHHDVCLRVSVTLPSDTGMQVESDGVAFITDFTSEALQ